MFLKLLKSTIVFYYLFHFIRLNDQLRQINHPMLKGFLTMQYNMQNMQIENMDLEQSGILQQIVIKQRDLNILKLEAQLKLRDNVF